MNYVKSYYIFGVMHIKALQYSWMCSNDGDGGAASATAEYVIVKIK